MSDYETEVETRPVCEKCGYIFKDFEYEAVIIDFGETRHIMLEVVSIKNDEFVISSASYVLRNEQTGEDETAGSCNITEHLIDTVIEPKERGEYQLIVTYKIADETLIDAVKVVVM